ncbi:hypothetical protein KCH_60550 [Kitasatospora cheerisanensis KCTC 2395]|uniref:Uncharacterized protein n=1 Tax=Kitasatospora cheerisanensis KCTC 2395 TaxID=1348663 RepID=A0A066YVX3_9ACTN|nr:hypothetical protein KCH_60550 [Kitasatospora cheerisanensis KCTC 2395]
MPGPAAAVRVAGIGRCGPPVRRRGGARVFGARRRGPSGLSRPRVAEVRAGSQPGVHAGTGGHRNGRRGYRGGDDIRAADRP